MKKFVFPLQPVLNWRDHLHNADRTHLQTLLTEQAKVRGASAEVDKELRTGVVEENLDSSELHRLATYKAFLRAKAVELEAQSELCQRKVTEQRSRCIESQRAQKIIEKLKQKRMADWKHSIDRESDSNAEETYVANWNRKLTL